MRVNTSFLVRTRYTTIHVDTCAFRCSRSCSPFTGPGGVVIQRSAWVPASCERRSTKYTAPFVFLCIVPIHVVVVFCCIQMYSDALVRALNQRGIFRYLTWYLTCISCAPRTYFASPPLRPMSLPEPTTLAGVDTWLGAELAALPPLESPAGLTTYKRRHSVEWSGPLLYRQKQRNCETAHDPPGGRKV